MKKLSRLLALALVVMMLCATLGTFGVHAAGERKIFISHFNQEDVYSNASVIFTKAYMDANGYTTLADITRAYKAKMADKFAAYQEWSDKYADHKFAAFYTMSIAWDEDNGYYKVLETVTSNGGNIACPDNGFLLSVHVDRVVEGHAAHNYPSTAFGELNLGNEAEKMAVISYWRAAKDQPVYLYNIDLEAADAASAIKTSGTFDSKISAAGLANGMTEIYQNFSSESYVMIGAEDPDATVAAFEPKNVTVSFKKIETLQADIARNYYEPDYTESSWADLQAALNAHTIGDESMTNKDVSAWAEEIKAARDALILVGSPEAEAEENNKGGNKGGSSFQDNTTGGGDSTLLIIIIVAAVLVLGGAAFLIFALKKKKKSGASDVKPVDAKPADEAKADEDKEEK